MKKQLILILLACVTVGCSQSSNEQQPEQKTVQQQTDDVPAIKIADDKLFVNDKEMLAKDFVDKYCFHNGVAISGNQTCREAYILQRKLDRRAGGAMPKNW